MMIPEKATQMLEEIYLNCNNDLSDWEMEFLDSISHQGFALTQAQKSKLRQIWEKYTNRNSRIV